MIEQKLTTYFARYKKLIPRAEFVSQSKSTISSSTQEAASSFSWQVRFMESMTTAGALAMASLLLLVLLGGFSYFAGGEGRVAVADPDVEALMKEASSLVASVEIREIDRFTESAEQVVSALDTLSAGSSF